MEWPARTSRTASSHVQPASEPVKDAIAAAMLTLLVTLPAYGQTEPMQTEPIKRYDAEGLETLLPPPFGPTNKAWLGRERGGRVDQHIARWEALAASGDDVEVRGLCPSACTLVLAHVPKERLCFSQTSVLAFHLARFPNGEPAIEASRAMFNAYPQDIRMWLQEKGGVEKMPLESFWLLFPSELWQMGYRRCDTLGTMPEHLPSVEEQLRALYKEKSRILEHLPMPSVEEQLRALDKEKSVGRYTCEERYTPGC
jgi:hypothetical protein